jgi:hypothetical protein
MVLRFRSLMTRANGLRQKQSDGHHVRSSGGKMTRRPPDSLIGRDQGLNLRVTEHLPAESRT